MSPSDPVSNGTSNSIVLGYVRALVWPVFALIVLGLFGSPLHQVADILPSLVSKSESISISGVSIKVSKSLGDRVSSEVRPVLEQLTPDDVRELLETADGTILFEKPDDPSTQAKSIATWKHLKGLGLATELTQNELVARNHDDQKNYTFGTRTTDLYPRVRDYVIEFTVQAVTEATVIKEPKQASPGGSHQ